VIVATVALEAVGPTVALEKVIPVATLDAIHPFTTFEAVLSVGPEERISAVGAGEDLRQGLVPGEERSDHHHHHCGQDVQSIHSIPCLSLPWSLCRSPSPWTLSTDTLVLGLYPTTDGGSLRHSRNDNSFGA
jgi:hypothetical protein